MSTLFTYLSSISNTLDISVSELCNQLIRAAFFYQLNPRAVSPGTDLLNVIEQPLELEPVFQKLGGLISVSFYSEVFVQQVCAKYTLMKHILDSQVYPEDLSLCLSHKSFLALCYQVLRPENIQALSLDQKLLHFKTLLFERRQQKRRTGFSIPKLVFSDPFFEQNRDIIEDLLSLHLYGLPTKTMFCFNQFSSVTIYKKKVLTIAQKKKLSESQISRIDKQWDTNRQFLKLLKEQIDNQQSLLQEEQRYVRKSQILPTPPPFQIVYPLQEPKLRFQIQLDHIVKLTNEPNTKIQQTKSKYEQLLTQNLGAEEQDLVFHVQQFNANKMFVEKTEKFQLLVQKVKSFLTKENVLKKMEMNIEFHRKRTFK
ncbi:Hypothetical_protein [Hexamita inflata]|uniref:Hypothetical_protein n=1 Tax=Hexamita inflata TaxID=28002 RepID=A0AA86VPU0_9EUKA|nr:Hypothetical protein HINF_LOCUS60363 [Hexamita inflata]